MTQTRLIQTFHPFTIPINDISIQQQLQQFLYTQLLTLDRANVTNCLSKNNPISLYKLPRSNSITYRCAIAFQLSPHSPLTPAETIFNTLQQPLSTQPDLYLTFTVKLLDPGWLDFTLCDRSLPVWLQSWSTFSYPHGLCQPKSGKLNNLWPLQYTYARCCTLLRLGEQEGLIKLKNQQFEPYLWPLSMNQQISWFSLTLNELERSLISELITTVDRLVNEPKVNKIKLAAGLSESFLNFERYCRIFGGISRHNPKLSQARLGLVAITQVLLQGLWLSQIKQPLRNRL
ncbi:MAG: arginyl-tRNA synthetase [Crocosphaera sp.]